MKTYTGYFDASTCYFNTSCNPKFSRCAFFIEENNKIIYKEVKEIPPTGYNNDSFLAEAKALSNLLEYVWNYIEPESHITIYGDAMSVINGIKVGRSPRLRDLIYKVNYLLNHYELEINFIPREENYKADHLTRTNPIDIDSVDLDSIDTINSKQFLKQEKINLNDIFIPKRIRQSQPNENKYQNRLAYFNNNGCLKTPLKVNDETNKFTLFDGFISYLILSNLGIDKYPAEIYCVKEYAV